MGVVQEIILLMVLTIVACNAYQQTVTVKGRLMCGDKPTNGKTSWVKVLNKRFGFDDMNEIAVQADGSFENTLSVQRSFGMTPELHIYTDCNDQTLYGTVDKGCQRKIKVKIPTKYVSSSTKSGPYDIGTYNLESKFHDEERDCSVQRTMSG